MQNQTIFNLHSFNPNARQGLILSLFEGLLDGESFVFVSDQDPTPLCRELDSARAANLRCEYQQKSANEWHVRIAKDKEEEFAQPEEGGCCGGCGGNGHG